MFTDEMKRIVDGEANRHDIDAAVLFAVIEVESAGRLTARVGMRDEPLIRWEGHYFDRLCDASVRLQARSAGLASPKAGAIANPASQTGRWALLERAAKLDAHAAYMSCSWGVGQVMGEHWKWLGYADVEALVGEARGGFGGQVELMMRYIRKAALIEAARTRNWEAFARGYNGPAYRRHGYHTRLAEAYRRHAHGRPEVTSPGDVLRLGDRGEKVEALQILLVRAGGDIAVDGRFGQETLRAVYAFQERNALAVDGLAGSRTIAALQASAQSPCVGGSGAGYPGAALASFLENVSRFLSFFGFRRV